MANMKFQKKHWKRYALCLAFAATMIILLLQTEVKDLLKDIARQAWIFIAMLAIKFGEENWWKPMMMGEAMTVGSESDSNGNNNSDDAGDSGTEV